MNFRKKAGKKKAAVAAVVCFVAAIAITGTYTFNDYKKSQSEKELAMAEENDITKEKYTVTEGESLVDENADSSLTEETEQNSDSVKDSSVGGDNEKEILDERQKSEENKHLEEEIATASNASAVNVSFSQDSMILWPVSGALLMDYSMDKTVYFKTLDQYKYNPAMVIAAAENDQIIAGAPGLVKSIDNSAQTGTTINIDLGNGYEALYGQLQKVAVKTGDYVDAATTLGYVAEPTKYYSSEGTNVYFEMRKDGQPIDPKEYLVDYAE